MKKLLLSGAVLLGLLSSYNAAADLIWPWSFATESGTIITEGTEADVQTGGTLTIIDFVVTASADPDNVGSPYTETQPTQALVWDGSSITEFQRGSGVFTNGSNFLMDDTDWTYTFFVGGAFVENEDSMDDLPSLAEGELTIGPPSVFTPSIPSLSVAGLAIMALLLTLTGLLVRSRA